MRLALRLAAAALLVALLLAAAESGVSSADSNGAHETAAVTLRPGDNFIGWIASEQPIETLFEAVSSIELAYTWDPERGRYLVAAPSLPRIYWTLRTLKPGMALIVRLSGAAPVQWQRPITPARGKTTLRFGENWVAWAGPDDWTIADAVKGIGASLIRAQRGEQIFERADPGSRAGRSRVQRGDALKVTVSRSVHWLQPTGIMPSVIFPGGSPRWLQAQVLEDLEAVQNYYASQFGIQVDPFDIDVLIPGDLDSLIEYYRVDHPESAGHEFDDEHVLQYQDLWDVAIGWFDGNIVVKQELWPTPQNRRGREILNHEYVHMLQSQLSLSVPTFWIHEGMATWMQFNDLNVYRGENAIPIDELHGYRRLAARGPSLMSTELATGNWEYTLGILAVNDLIDRAGAGALVELYRSLLPTQPRASIPWRRQPPWPEVFADVFGITIQDFYTEFNEWQGSLPGRTTVQPGSNERTLSGRVVRADGAPLASVLVAASKIADGVAIGHARGAETSADGRFRLFVPGRFDDRQVRLEVRLGRHQECVIWHATGVATTEINEATLLQSHVDDVEIVVPADVCQYSMSGQLIGPDGDVLPGFVITLHESDGAIATKAITDRGGGFSIIAPRNGIYNLGAYLDGCQIYYHSDHGSTADQNAAQRNSIDGRDLTAIRIVVPGGVCDEALRGVVVDADGEGVDGVRVRVSADGRGSSAYTSWDGSFSIWLPDEESYRLRATLSRRGSTVDACDIYYHHQQGGVASRDLAAQISRNSAETEVRLVIGADMCKTEIGGKLLDADGGGVGNVVVYAQWDDDRKAFATTDAQGVFSIRVPEPGPYILGTEVEDCEFFYRSGGVSVSRDEATVINVLDENVTGVRFQMHPVICSKSASSTN